MTTQGNLFGEPEVTHAVTNKPEAGRKKRHQATFPPEAFMVSQEVFLSWTPRVQFLYCAARDRDSLLDENISDDEFRLFATRAAMYEEAAKEL